MNITKLDHHPRIKSGFTAPESYFDSLSNSMLPQSVVKKVRPLWQNPLVYAACLAAVALGIAFLFLQENETPDTATVEQYLITYEGINDHVLAEHLSESDLDQLSVNLQLSAEEIEQNLSEAEYLEEIID